MRSGYGGLQLDLVPIRSCKAGKVGEGGGSYCRGLEDYGRTAGAVFAWRSTLGKLATCDMFARATSTLHAAPG